MPPDRFVDLSEQHCSIHGFRPWFDLAQFERGRRCSATLLDQPVQARKPKFKPLGHSLTFTFELKG